MEDKWNIFILSYSISPTLKWKIKVKSAPLCNPTAYAARLLSICAVLRALLCLLAAFWCVCCVCYLSLSLSFSCFMVSPRKKYSFRSVIFNAIKKKNPHATFSLPSLRSLHLLHREVVNRDGLILYLLDKTYCMFLHRAKVESKMGLQVE